MTASACRTGNTPARRSAAARSAACPAQLPAPPLLPGERPAHRLADYWLSKSVQPQGVLMDAGAIAQHNARVLALRDGSWPNGRWQLLDRTVDRAEITRQLDERLTYLRGKIAEGKALTAAGTRPDGLVARLGRLQQQATQQDELRVAWRTTPLRCYPTDEGLYEAPDLHAFDLTQCSQIRFGEPVRVLLRSPRFWYVWTSYATGWADPGAFGPPIDAERAKQWLSPRASVVLTRDRVPIWRSPAKGSLGAGESPGGALLGAAPLGARFPLLSAADGPGPVKVLVPTPDGLRDGWIRRRAAVSLGHTPLTRAALLRRAFSLLDEPYGWGGMGDRRDCSRFLLDLFGSFGLLLPRNSSMQAKAGQRRIDVEGLSDADKVRAIEQAAQGGVVLLYFPGHIMLYLGRDGDQLYAIHQFSGYLVPCPGGDETMYRANRTAVTSLDLGRGGSRRSFLERTTRLIVFGSAPPDVGG